MQQRQVLPSDPSLRCGFALQSASLYAQSLMYGSIDNRYFSARQCSLSLDMGVVYTKRVPAPMLGSNCPRYRPPHGKRKYPKSIGNVDRVGEVCDKGCKDAFLDRKCEQEFPLL